MTKFAGLLAVVALGLLLASFLPWPNNAAEVETAIPAEEKIVSEYEQGRALFLAKGCVTCHVHDALDELSALTSVGPNLSDYRPEPDFVRRWLRDPAAVKSGTQMPNLALDEVEIESLIAFLAGASEKPADLAAVSKGCPVSQPSDPPFIPPDPAISKEDALLKAPALGSLDGYFWFGSESLWTQLRLDGQWADLPHHEHGYTQKIFFGSQGYNWREEPQPALTVSGRRLDVPGPVFEALEATNGFHPDMGSFMLVGVDVPTAGCWEITGHYEGHALSFVVWITPA